VVSGTVQDVNNVVRIKILAEWQAGDILRMMDKAKGGQPYQDHQATDSTVESVENVPTLVELGLGATRPQALKTAYRVQLVRDAADQPADIDKVIDRLSAQGKQVSSPMVRRTAGW
jgi:hypothetical protein